MKKYQLLAVIGGALLSLHSCTFSSEEGDTSPSKYKKKTGIHRLSDYDNSDTVVLIQALKEQEEKRKKDFIKNKLDRNIEYQSMKKKLYDITKKIMRAKRNARFGDGEENIEQEQEEKQKSLKSKVDDIQKSVQDQADEEYDTSGLDDIIERGNELNIESTKEETRKQSRRLECSKEETERLSRASFTQHKKYLEKKTMTSKKKQKSWKK